MKNKVVVSAPGKLSLMGEHAVVYGRPCLVVAVNKRINVVLEKNELDEWPDSKFISESVKVFRDEFQIASCVKILPTTAFPRNLGLGSSSAVTVATMFGLAKLFLEKDLEQKKLFELCFKAVKNVQGVGSGFDIAAAIHGGAVYYKNRGEIINPFMQNDIPLVVGFTGFKADTVAMVDLVAQKKKENDLEVTKVFNHIGELVERGKIALFEHDWETLGSLMNLDQEYLVNLGVSTEKLDRMIESAVKAGAYGAKLSGAGGGDCMLALVSVENEQAVKEAIEKVGGTILSLKLEPSGVREEKLS